MYKIMMDNVKDIFIELCMLIYELIVIKLYLLGDFPDELLETISCLTNYTLLC